MKKVLLFASLMLMTSSAFSQTFTWTTNDSVVEDLAQNSTVQFPLHQQAIGTDTITLAIEVIYNDIPQTWDGMLCIYGSCLGSIPVVGTTAQMQPIHGSLEGMVRMTVNPLNGTESCKIQVYVYDINDPNDGDTATFIFNQTAGVEEMNALSEGLKIYPNPAVSSVWLESNTNLTSAIIYDLTGKEVSNLTLGGLNATMNVETFEPGTYVVIITDDQGNTTTKKFTKE